MPVSAVVPVATCAAAAVATSDAKPNDSMLLRERRLGRMGTSFANLRDLPVYAAPTVRVPEERHPCRRNGAARQVGRNLGGRQRPPTRLHVQLRRDQAAWDPRWAQPVVCCSMTLNSSYITIAIAPTTTRPANARPIC